MKLVIVESPSKAKTIGKYLGKDYSVIASYGHIRQLPSKQGSVDPENKFKMIWEETDQAKKHLKEIKNATKNIEEIYLATDPDREGEAISWHIANYLNENKLIKSSTPLKRVVFNAITKDNIKDAFTNPRKIDNKLVEAYITRLSLDYLVGFNISPILWHKLPGAKSAGRVQSVALRLVCEKEEAIENFISEEYWTIEALFDDYKNNQFLAKLVTFNNKKLEKLDIKNQKQADEIKGIIQKDKSFYIKDIIKKKLTRNPNAPFTTSSLQQDAFNKLGFTAKKTMSIAQKLYEGVSVGKETIGLITYMRTDATQITPSFVEEIRFYINDKIGKEYLAKSIRQFKTKAKNAQEAHEAIRPASISFPPSLLKTKLSDDEYRLYELIWNRSIASQMEGAKYSNTTFEIHNSKSDIVLKATGSILEFDGFYKVYEKNLSKDTENENLPNLEINTKLDCKEVKNKQSFTEPPARYTEATLVKNLEELGIGRPSTYASIISVLIFRQYARIENKKFHLEDRGRILNVFLTKFFSKYVDYNFTANMEEQLDSISNGTLDHLEVLSNFWTNFHKEVEYTKTIAPTVVFDALNLALADKFIGDNRACPNCNKGILSIKNSKFGPFIGCSLYPECKYTKKLHLSTNEQDIDKDIDQNNNSPILILDDKINNKQIYLKKGPYGVYLEMLHGKNKPKRISIPKNIDPTTLDINKSLFLLDLPKNITNNISLGVGRFGPYLKKDSFFYSFKGDIFTLTEEQANSIVKEQEEKKTGVVLGTNPKDNEIIKLKSDRFGWYLDYKNKKIKIPKEYKELKNKIPLEIAIKILSKN